MSIFASLLWAGAACTTLVLQKRPEADFNSPAPVVAAQEAAVPAAPTPGAEEVVTKNMSPDGTLTTTYTTTITNPDGSKTVTETTEVTPPEPVMATSEVTPASASVVHETGALSPGRTKKGKCLSALLICSCFIMWLVCLFVLFVRFSGQLRNTHFPFFSTPLVSVLPQTCTKRKRRRTLLR
jgi:hypothetical protein